MGNSNANRWLGLAANLGVFVGLILLVVEMRQNTDLMRAQISMERAVTNMQILSDLANGGSLIPIDVKLRDRVAGFPYVLGWSDMLTPEEKRRYQFWMFLRLTELNNDWFQCAARFVPEDACEKEVRDNMRRSLHRFHELGIAFTRSDAGFIEVMQEFAREADLPAIADDGSWQ